MSGTDGYEEYEPLQPVSSYEPMKDVASDSKAEEKGKSVEEKFDEMSISSHSGEQLLSPVIDELKSKINGIDEDADLPPSDYPDEDYPETKTPVNEENEVDETDNIDNLYTVVDRTPTNVTIGESGEASYLSLFSTRDDDNEGNDAADTPDVSVMSPGGTSYFSLFDAEGQPLDVVLMSPDDIADIKEEMTESNIEVIVTNHEEDTKNDEDDLVDVVVVSQDDITNIKDEMGKSNVDVLNQIAKESTSEEEKGNVQMLLQWARSKSGKMPKTYTMKAREARKMESFKKAVDVGSRSIVIFEKEASAENKEETVVHESKKALETKKSNDSLLPSDTGITREFLEAAVTAYEQGAPTTLLSMKFSKPMAQNETVTDITAQVGGKGEKVSQKSYRWIIITKKQGSLSSAAQDMQSFMSVQLGPKLATYISEMTKNKRTLAEAPGRTGSIRRSNISLPFHPLVYTDGNYEIFDDISSFKTTTLVDGLDLPHMKAALKSLAQLHAIGFAYSVASKKNKNSLISVNNSLEVLFDNPYKSSASKESQQNEKSKLSAMFETLLKVIRANKAEGGESVAKKLESRFKTERIFNIYKEALEGQSNFSTVCHGFPTSQTFMFQYDGKSSDVPVGVEIVGFDEARYTNAMTDVHILFGTSLGAEIQNRANFLLRFVYHETLTYTMQSLKVNSKDIIEFEDLQKEFKRTETFGKLASAMHLALNTEPKHMSIVRKQNPTTGSQKGVYSKILGGSIGGGTSNVKSSKGVDDKNDDNTLPAPMRALELVRDLS